jgi:APA family basic amino acid/polyamine antiporter
MKNHKKISLWTAISIVIGCVIGSGVFVKPGRVLQATGDSNSALMAWVIGGLITLAGGLTLAEIASRIPKTGGIYTYIEELFGKPWAFVSGWVQSIIYGPAISAAISLYFGSLLVQLIGADESLVKPVALITLALLSLLISLSTSYGTNLQNAITFVKLIPIAALGFGGLLMGDMPILNISLPAQVEGAGMGVAILATLWAYDGWVQVANLGEHIDSPSKNLPKAFIYGIAGVMFVYLLINIALFHIMPVADIAILNEKAAAVAAESLFGSWAGKALSLGIIISILGAVNGNILTMPLVPFSMSQMGMFPFAKTFGAINFKTNTPVNSIVLKSSLSAVMILLLNPDRITDIAMFIMYVCYAAVFLGIFILRKKYGVPEKGNYKTPLYPLMPIAASGGSLYVCYSMLVQQPLDGLIALAIALSGLPIYFWLTRKVK